jgi:uncharacterized surface protein with fasciclin (FAS1) repeats
MGTRAGRAFCPLDDEETFMSMVNKPDISDKKELRSMNIRARTLTAASLAASCLFLAGIVSADGGEMNGKTCNQAVQTPERTTSVQKTTKEKKMNIVQTAIAAGSFKTLVAAVQAAGLVPTLEGKGPFTVFAPTDEAFAKLPKGTVEDLLKPENKAKLTAILTYHVISGEVMAADVVKVKSAKTVEGKAVTVKVTDGKVMIDDANVTKTDIITSNGVIHVIDTVLIPKEN